MSFTRKHYEETARIIREARTRYWSTHGAGAAHDIQDELSTMFASDNPRFDAERFAKACEPGRAK